ncbi:hypothetical protein MHY20_09250 [Helcobacillus sp. ACRRO]|uniref:hypothetical protein n=1 Tax=Helcobacillus sp. ACRRO TaxID=2918202 RepID=UPI001EF5D134|nr:hypothetical protein [Helcobacillus sp. ACRRO]MCG7427788.1 hypothetical protein [Helcobacillus sp. ACRRO]
MTDSLTALLHRFDTEPMTASERWDIGRRAEQLADEAGDDQQLYAVRMRLIGHAREVSDTDAQLSMFLWCAFKHDQDPARFPTRPVPGSPGIDLLWWYKWLIDSLLSRPQYSLDQIRTSLSMMEAAYRRDGAGAAGPLWARLQLAMDHGSDDDIRTALAAIRTTPRDAYSHCDACAQASEVSIRLSLGETDEALHDLEALLASEDLCAEEPEGIASEMLVELCRAGKAERAAELQEMSYPRIMSMPVHLPLQARHMLFFAVTGNVGRAHELLVRHLPNLFHTGVSPSGRLSALTLLLRVARLLQHAGYGHLVLPGTDTRAARSILALPAPSTADQNDAAPVGPLTITQFADAARDRALRLAAQFDRRSGHTRSTDAVRRAEENLDERFPLDLGGREVLEAALPPLPSDQDTDGIELGLELSYIARGHDDPMRMDYPPRIVLREEADTERKLRALSVLLQHEETRDFEELFQLFLLLHADLEHDEFALKQREHGEQLWRPIDAAPAGDGPVWEPFDPVAEWASAASPEWRLEVALQLAPLAAQYWEEVAEDAYEEAALRGEEALAELTAWEERGLNLLVWAVESPESQWERIADDLHRAFAEQLADLPNPDWYTVMALIVVNARLSFGEHRLADALREGLDQFQSVTMVPPSCHYLMALLYQESARVGNAIGQVTAMTSQIRAVEAEIDAGVDPADASVLMRSLGIDIAGYPEIDPFADLMEGRITAAVEHPLLVAHLWIRASAVIQWRLPDPSSSRAGTAEQYRMMRLEAHKDALRAARLGLLAVERAEASGAAKSDAERAFISRADGLNAIAAAIQLADDRGDELQLVLQDLITFYDGALAAAGTQSNRAGPLSALIRSAQAGARTLPMDLETPIANAQRALDLLEDHPQNRAQPLTSPDSHLVSPDSHAALSACLAIMLLAIGAAPESEDHLDRALDRVTPGTDDQPILRSLLGLHASRIAEDMPGTTVRIATRLLEQQPPRWENIAVLDALLTAAIRRTDRDLALAAAGEMLDHGKALNSASIRRTAHIHRAQLLGALTREGCDEFLRAWDEDPAKDVHRWPLPLADLFQRSLRANGMHATAEEIFGSA